MDSAWICGAVCVVGAYLLGSVSFALVLSRARGVDLRKHGSGNLGATNVTRVLGKTWGRLCFLCDLGKGAIPVLVAAGLAPEEGRQLIPVLTGAASVAGHVWPVYLRFKGGKGVATSMGVMLALAPVSFVCAGVLWIVLFYATRYVSVASLAAAVMLPVSAGIVRMVRPIMVPTPTLVLLVAIALLIVVKHKANISRLLKGEENRFERKKEAA